ncbi:MAG: hypothetical protein IJU45_05725, partial [Clostridia bacterium]|nr:hypothetical protein [Clostridia bacterium]
MVFEHSRWIWWRRHAENDEYGDFYACFEAREDGEPLIFRIAVDGDYALYLNGVFVSSNSYNDYPENKVYDELSLAPFVKKGKNHAAIRVWHPGETNFHYAPTADAGLIFEIVGRDGPRLASGEATLARRSGAFVSGRKQQITSQLGYGFRYNAEREDGWMTGDGDGFAPAVPRDLPC